MEIGKRKIINMGIVIKLVRKRTKIEVGNWKNENSKYGDYNKTGNEKNKNWIKNARGRA